MTPPSDPPTKDEARHAVATAMFDALNTARLSEHPEEAEDYGNLADGFLTWLEVQGFAVTKIEVSNASARSALTDQQTG